MKTYAFAALSGAACLFAAGAALSEPAGDSVYVARLSPLNATVTGSDAKGEAKFEIKGDTLSITVDAEGTPGGIMHLQHFHGFADQDKAAACPGPDADTNKDGIIDLIETEPAAGTTMVPFHAHPVTLEIPSDTYPAASPRGAYRYQISVPLDELKDAFAKKFGGQDLALDKRVVFIHGVPESADLPDTTASLEGVPAHITLPIACGEIKPAG